MPAAVAEYVRSKDFREVDRIQRALLRDYQYDIAHYATAEEKVKAENLAERTEIYTLLLTLNKSTKILKSKTVLFIMMHTLARIRQFWAEM